MSNKENNHSKEDKRDNVQYLSAEEKKKQMKRLREQLLQHKDVFIRLRDK